MAMDCTGSNEGVIGIKNKYVDVIEHVQSLLTPEVRIHALTDTYPAGDEFVLVHDILKRVIPPGGLPKDVGAVVCNVETLLNIGNDKPVTHKYLTVAGAVARPVTLRAPIGITIKEAIEAAGGPTSEDFGVLLGGVMMGKLASSLDGAGDEDAGRDYCFAGESSADSALQRHLEANPSHRKSGVRSVPVLHGHVSAVFVGTSH